MVKVLSEVKGFWNIIEQWGRSNPVALGIIMLIIVGIFGFIKGKVVKNWFLNTLRNWHIKKYYLEKSRGHLNELRGYIKTHELLHPAVSMIMAMVAKRTSTDMLSPDGELLYIEEYLEILDECLSKNLSKCIFIARTKPSDWFIDKERDPQLVKILKCKGQSYLKKQGELKKVDIERYTVLKEDDWENDQNRDPFINLNTTNGITLHFCPHEDLNKGFTIRDTSIFTDKTGKSWIVESLDFNEETIAKYAESNLPLHIKVRIEDRAEVIAGWFKHFLKNLQQAIKETHEPKKDENQTNS